jgi:hypothetical protein
LCFSQPLRKGTWYLLSLLLQGSSSSTTLINVVVPGSLVVREGGETHNVVNKYVGGDECDKTRICGIF